MDIYCLVCAEPVDNDYLHDVAEEQGSTYEKVAAAFRVKGCEALGTTHGTMEPSEATKEMIAITYEMNGDDMDGAASTFDDMGEMMGL